MHEASTGAGNLSGDNVSLSHRQFARQARARRLFWFTLAVSLAALLAPAAAIFDVKLWLASWLPYAREIDAANLTQNADKWVHFTMFGLLGLLGLRAWLSIVPVPHLLGSLLGLALATEWLQHYIPGRSASLADLVADLLGLGLGLLAWRALRNA